MAGEHPLLQQNVGLHCDKIIDFRSEFSINKSAGTHTISAQALLRQGTD